MLSIYNRASTHVSSEAGVIDKFSVAVGLHQGSTISPHFVSADYGCTDIGYTGGGTLLVHDGIDHVEKDALEEERFKADWYKSRRNWKVANFVTNDKP